MTSLFFFFSCYGDHRDLHSFPTRRSSDLALVAALDAREHETQAHSKRVSEYTLYLAREMSVDRKSTRLNSSHRCISYAVFCLKKKKKTTTGHHSKAIATTPTICPLWAPRF